MQPRFLSDQSKRICKSEESAIDNATLSLPRNVCSISSDETLNGTNFDKTRNPMSRVRNSYDNETNDVTVLESDIEIMVPMSVSKPKVSSSDGAGNPVIGSRQRSSNSVSSCEMALSSSLVDGEDSSNGNSSIRNDDNCDGVFVSQENIKSSGDCKSSLGDRNAENESHAEKCKAEGADNTSFFEGMSDSQHSSEKMQDCDREESLVLAQVHPNENISDARYFRPRIFWF